jgi:hypothetical protein
LHGASPAPLSDPSAPAAPDRAAAAARRPAYASEPQSIAKSYYIEEKAGERRYFDDYKRKALAMRATETSITSKREDLNTIRAMLDIAEARGWHSLQIRGSAEFKREAWIEATARGLEGRGFTASDLDRQEADRRRAERGPANEVRARATTTQAPKPEPARTVSKDSTDAPATATPDRAASTARRSAYAPEPAPIAKSYYVEEKAGERRSFTDAREAGAAYFEADRSQRPGVVQELKGNRARLFATTEIHGHYENGDQRFVKRLPSQNMDGAKEFRAGYFEALEKSVVERLKATDWEQAKPDHPAKAPNLDGKLYDDLESLSRADSDKAMKVWADHAPSWATAPTFVDPAWKKETAQARRAADLDKDGEPVKPTIADNRKVLRETHRELSEDGRLILAALSEKIDRQMNRHNAETKAELKAFVASELVKKERTEGPIVLSAGQKRAASAPRPVQAAPKPEPTPAAARRIEPDAPRRTIGR